MRRSGLMVLLAGVVVVAASCRSDAASSESIASVAPTAPITAVEIDRGDTIFLRPVLQCQTIAASTPDETMAVDVGSTDTTRTENLFVLAAPDSATREICTVGPAGGTGAVFEPDATAELAESGWGITVSLRPGADGQDVWNDLATQCNHATPTCPTGRLAIQVGQDIISAPAVQTDFFEGQVTITGAFTESDARSLADVFVAGASSID